MSYASQVKGCTCQGARSACHCAEAQVTEPSPLEAAMRQLPSASAAQAVLWLATALQAGEVVARSEPDGSLFLGLKIAPPAPG